MADRGRRRGRAPVDSGQSLDAGAYEPLPKRGRARRRIDRAGLPSLAEPEARERRRLSRAERDRARTRYEQRHALPPQPPVERPPRRTHWWTRVAVLALFAVLVGSIAAGRYLAPDDRSRAFATVTATDPAAALITILTPSPTNTATPTETPTFTPTPTPTATPNPNLIGKVVCLDPGHGGSDPGFERSASDVAPAMREADLNLAFATALKSRLQLLGITVVMTRESDTDVNAVGIDVNGDGRTVANLQATDPAAADRAQALDELQARINICNAANADLLISMHINGFNDPAANGYETWYSSARPFKELSKSFAQFAFQEIGKAMQGAGYAARPRLVNDDINARVETATESFDRYIITGPAQPGQIVASAMPGAIVETLFISNEADAAFLASKAGGEAIVAGYERAVVRYFDMLAQ